MKKSALFLLVLATITIFSVALCEAGSTAVAPFVGDKLITLDIQDLGGSIGVISVNNTQNTAMAVVLDASGNPDSLLLGVAYLYADFFTHELWGSNDGVNWAVIGTI